MSADASGAGLAPERVAAPVAALARLVDARRLPGAVLHVERRGRIAVHEVIGVRDPASGAPLRDDAIFRICSMTKPIVSVAAMQCSRPGASASTSRSRPTCRCSRPPSRCSSAPATRRWSSRRGR